MEHRLKTRLQITAGDLLGDAVCNRRNSQRVAISPTNRSTFSGYCRRTLRRRGAGGPHGCEAHHSFLAAFSPTASPARGRSC
jgi:hypothetical protein